MDGGEKVLEDEPPQGWGWRRGKSRHHSCVLESGSRGPEVRGLRILCDAGCREEWHDGNDQMGNRGEWKEGNDP